MKIIIGASVLILISFPAAASSFKTFQKCSKNPDSKRRSSCLSTLLVGYSIKRQENYLIKKDEIRTHALVKYQSDKNFRRQSKILCERKSKKSAQDCKKKEGLFKQQVTRHRQENRSRDQILYAVQKDPITQSKYFALKANITRYGKLGPCMKSANATSAINKCKSKWIEAQHQHDAFVKSYLKQTGQTLTPLTQTPTEMEALGAEIISCGRNRPHSSITKCMTEENKKRQITDPDPEGKGRPYGQWAGEQAQSAVCFASGGEWTTFASTCTDTCDLYISEVCGSAMTPACDCGPNKCSFDNQCVNNPKWHQSRKYQ